MINVGDYVLVVGVSDSTIYTGLVLKVTEAIPVGYRCDDGSGQTRSFREMDLDNNTSRIIEHLKAKVEEVKAVMVELARPLPTEHPLRIKAARLELD